MAEARARQRLEQTQPDSPLTRARAAAAIGSRALEPRTPVTTGTDSVVCELYRESIYWTLLARHAGTPGAELEARPDFETLWATTDRAFLLGSTTDELSLHEIERAVLHRSFVDFAELPARDQVVVAKGLRVFAESLLHRLDAKLGRMDALLVQRLLRMALLLALFASLGLVAAFVLFKLEERSDLARGMPWKSSSFVMGCTSPAQRCEETPGFFFHTQEEQNPWLEIDLGTPHHISGVKVSNREDCCSERAVPLVIEVSTDHQAYKQVARRDKDFNTWRASFAPVDARWVRLRAAKKTSLHLDHVQVR